jgi:endogenous inhibitor of DNA gyrase (YacG/DUF329 family)
MTRRRSNQGQAPDTADAQTMATRIVNCPHCGGDSVYAASNPYRPFCCQRCKDIDFGAWAEESFKVPEDPDAHDDDSRLQ